MSSWVFTRGNDIARIYCATKQDAYDYANSLIYPETKKRVISYLENNEKYSPEKVGSILSEDIDLMRESFITCSQCISRVGYDEIDYADLKTAHSLESKTANVVLIDKLKKKYKSLIGYKVNDDNKISVIFYKEEK